MAYVPIIPYADTAYADAYFAERVDADSWAPLDIAVKERALKHATKLVDQCDFVLEKTDEDQAREFPRAGETEVPDEVLQATCEVAYELTVKNRLPENMTKKAGITSESVGDTSRSWGAGGVSEILGESSGLPSTQAAILLRDWIEDPRELQLQRTS